MLTIVTPHFPLTDGAMRWGCRCIGPPGHPKFHAYTCIIHQTFCIVPRTYIRIYRYYPDRELMVMKTHEFAVFQDRYKALSKDYNIAGCRIFMNLRNPIDQLASYYVQSHRELDANGKMQAAVFDAASYPNLREEFQTWFSHGRKAAALWQTSADLFMLWTGRPLESLIETGIPVVHKVKGSVASEFPNSTLHIHRTEDLSDDGVPKQKVENAKTDFLMQLACEFVRQQKNKDGHYAYTFCVAWSDCCKDLKS